jgi:hypothetical protein
METLLENEQSQAVARLKLWVQEVRSRYLICLAMPHYGLRFSCARSRCLLTRGPSCSTSRLTCSSGTTTT